MQQKTILGIDPGTKEMGLAVVRGRELLHFGVRTLRNGTKPYDLIGQARRIVDQPIERRQFFEWLTLHEADRVAMTRRSTRSSPIAATASPPPTRPSSAASRMSSGTASMGRSAKRAHAAAIQM